MLKRTIDLNCDIGEGFGIYQLNDEAIMPYISSANIACGFHAGDPFQVYKTVSLAKKYDVAIGAHPSFPDLLGFGRREMSFSDEEIYQLVLYQVGAIYSICKAQKVELRHVKPHGALYNMAAKNRYLAVSIAKAIKAFDPQLILFGLANSKLIEAAIEVGIPYASEVFADRLYNDDGLLVNRNQPNAVHASMDSAIEQAIQLVLDKTVTTITGNKLSLVADTICLHGDSSIAVELASKIRNELEKNEITIHSIGV